MAWRNIGSLPSYTVWIPGTTIIDRYEGLLGELMYINTQTFIHVELRSLRGGSLDLIYHLNYITIHIEKDKSD